MISYSKWKAPMRYLAVVDNVTGATMLATPEEAEALTHIRVSDLVRVIAEHGVCNSLDHTVLDTRPADDLIPAG